TWVHSRVPMSCNRSGAGCPDRITRTSHHNRRPASANATTVMPRPMTNRTHTTWMSTCAFRRVQSTTPKAPPQGRWYRLVTTVRNVTPGLWHPSPFADGATSRLPAGGVASYAEGVTSAARDDTARVVPLRPAAPTERPAEREEPLWRDVVGEVLRDVRLDQ